MPQGRAEGQRCQGPHPRGGARVVCLGLVAAGFPLPPATSRWEPGILKQVSVLTSACSPNPNQTGNFQESYTSAPGGTGRKPAPINTYSCPTTSASRASSLGQGQQPPRPPPITPPNPRCHRAHVPDHHPPWACAQDLGRRRG